MDNYRNYEASYAVPVLYRIAMGNLPNTRPCSSYLQDMILRRLLLPVALLVLSVAAFAQLTASEKREVLTEMQRVLTDEAFVPGVDLERFPDFLKKRTDSLDAAESPSEFARVINSSLEEFGISHIQVIRPRMRRRGGGGEVPELFQGSSRFRRDPDSLEWVDDDSAVLKIHSFAGGYDPDGIEMLFDKAASAKYLVIDLRANPGGRVDYLQHFLGFLLPENTAVGTFVSRRAAQEFIKSGKGDGKDPIAIAQWTTRKFRAPEVGIRPFAGKIAVLVDGESASASEIVAAALRETKRSPIIGSRTAGAVLMSTFERLPHGFSIQYPVSDYVSIQGVRLEGHPLSPDVSTAVGESAVEAALKKLKG